MKKPSRPRAGLIRRAPAVLYKSPSETRAFLVALSQSATDDALKKQTGHFLDISEKLARAVFCRHGIDPENRYRYDADRRAADLPPDLGRDTELAFARDILGRVGGLRFALERDFRGDPGAWVAVACFGLANAVASLQIEFDLGPAYSAGAKSIASAKEGAILTAQARGPKIQAKHRKWEEIDARLSPDLKSGRRYERIAREVANTPHRGKADTIRKYFDGKKSGKVPATLPNGR